MDKEPIPYATVASRGRLRLLPVLFVTLGVVLLVGVIVSFLNWGGMKNTPLIPSPGTFVYILPPSNLYHFPGCPHFDAKMHAVRFSSLSSRYQPCPDCTSPEIYYPPSSAQRGATWLGVIGAAGLFFAAERSRSWR